MDSVRSPFAPDAGPRPPELAGRDGDLRRSVVLEHATQLQTSIILNRLRGVDRKIRLDAMRSTPVRRGWDLGKWEVRRKQAQRHPLAAPWHLTLSELDPLRPNRR